MSDIKIIETNPSQVTITTERKPEPKAYTKEGETNAAIAKMNADTQRVAAAARQRERETIEQIAVEGVEQNAKLDRIETAMAVQTAATEQLARTVTELVLLLKGAQAG